MSKDDRASLCNTFPLSFMRPEQIRYSKLPIGAMNNFKKMSELFIT